MISSTVLVQLIEGLCLKRIAYRSCSKEWAFLGFHRISDIQFFWRWNISPSSLLADRKMSTKSKIVRQVFPKEADMLIFHVTWWKSVCCYMTYDVFPYTVTVLAPALRELYSDFSFIFIAIYFKTTMSQSVDRLRQLEEIEKVCGISPIGETFFHVSLLHMAHLIHYLLHVISF